MSSLILILGTDLTLYLDFSIQHMTGPAHFLRGKLYCATVQQKWAFT